jgi:hypothetical protein
MTTEQLSKTDKNADTPENRLAHTRAAFLAAVQLGYIRRTGNLKKGQPVFESLIVGKPDAVIDRSEWDRLTDEIYRRHTNAELAKLELGDN